MTARTILAGNWKMKLGADKARALTEKLVALGGGLKKSEIWIAPSFTAIPACSELTRNSAVKLGAQNVHWDADGAFTGEIALPMLKEFGCQFAIVGHSERRHVFGESHAMCAKRALVNLKQKFTVVFCVGETLEERKQGITSRVLEDQLKPLIAELSAEDAQYVVIAYEPVWAIGTGVVAQVPDIASAHGAINSYWQKSCPAKCPPILYGGSVTPENLKEILGVELVAGALIGGASLKYESMEAMAKVAELL